MHRDIKPGNILVHEYAGDPWQVKLLDFGLAKPVSPDATQLTGKGRLAGTPRYMAPEQVLGLDAVPASDIYTLGLVAFEMLAGEPAIDGATVQDLLVAQVKGPQIRLPAHVPRGLARVVERMCARPMDERFGGADEVRAALQHVEQEEHAPQPHPQPKGSSATAGSVAHGRSRLVVVIGLAAIIGVVAIVAAALWPSSGTRPPAASRPVDPVVAVRPKAPLRPVQDVVPAELAPTSELARSGADCSPGSPGLRVRTLGGWALGGGREILTYVPKSFDPDANPGIVGILRSTNRQAEGFVRHTEFMEIAERENLVLFAPVPKKLLPGNWRTDEPITAARLDLEAIRTGWCLESADVFLLGFTTGGRGVDQLLCGDERLTAVAVSAHMWLEHDHLWCTPRRRVPFLDLTQVVGHEAEYAAQTPRREQLYGCTGDATLYDDWEFPRGRCTSRTCEAPLVTCEIQSGLMWPHDSDWRPDEEAWGEPVPREGFPYRKVVWDFFERHRPKR